VVTDGAVRSVGQPLAGRVAAVLRAETGPGAELAAGLADLGATLVPLADVDPDAGVELVVVPILPGGEVGRRPLVELGPDGWADACEAPLLAVRRGLVAARHALAGGGTIVVVGPVAAITGEAGLVGYAAAAEGARALALSCARSWGVHGITVHWVATVTSLLSGAEPAERVVLWDEALGRPPTLRGDVAAAVAGLAAPTMRFVTGTSITVDGGIVLHT
jgi:NAD(P)-dependent dehydrogenase (short-subunit alcohol dehydrogenase family)